jgi:hypothetical protein
MSGAGDGNRTHVASLEGWSSTIELHPRRKPTPTAKTESLLESRSLGTPGSWWGVEDLNLRRLEPADLQSAPFDRSGNSPTVLLRRPSEISVARRAPSSRWSARPGTRRSTPISTSFDHSQFSRFFRPRQHFRCVGPAARFELATTGLQNRCSTVELRWRLRPVSLRPQTEAEHIRIRRIEVKPFPGFTPRRVSRRSIRAPADETFGRGSRGRVRPRR